jgi:hypothetical protein
MLGRESASRICDNFFTIGAEKVFLLTTLFFIGKF